MGMDRIVAEWRLLKQIQSLKGVPWSAIDRYGVLFLPLREKVAIGGLRPPFF
jgi:hypothetical protein